MVVPLPRHSRYSTIRYSFRVLVLSLVANFLIHTRMRTFDDVFNCAARIKYEIGLQHSQNWHLAALQDPYSSLRTVYLRRSHALQLSPSTHVTTAHNLASGPTGDGEYCRPAPKWHRQ